MTNTQAVAETPTATDDSYRIASYINGHGFSPTEEVITAGTDYDLGDPLATVADWLAGFVLDNLQASSDETVTDSVRVDIFSPARDVLASGYRNIGETTNTETTKEGIGPFAPPTCWCGRETVKDEDIDSPAFGNYQCTHGAAE